METIIIVAVISFAILCAVAAANAKKKKKLYSIYKAIPNFNADKEFVNANGSVIGCDQKNKKIVVFNKLKAAESIQRFQTSGKLEEYETTTLTFDEILKTEIRINDSTYSTKSTAGTIGRTIAGGLLMGGVGAIVGGLTGKSTGHKSISEIELLITTNNISNPLVKYKFMDTQEFFKRKEVPANDFLIKKSIEKADEWSSIFTIIQSQKSEVAG